jgi:outer membrane protein, multidrug efflux system
VERALRANNDLRAALARYDNANALLREVKFDRYPTINASASGGHEEVSQDQAFGFPRNFRTYSVGVNASWELDFFGRVRRGVEAQRANVAARAADVATAQVAIAGRVASVYMELRGLQERLRVARENAENQAQTVRLVETRLSAGRGTDFDTARARAQLEVTSSRVPAFEARIALDEHLLSVLTGQLPEALVAELDAPRPLPVLPASIDPGTPADLLRRRPDVASAEAQLHAATALIGVATADIFPRLTLLGELGTQAFHSDALFKPSATTSLGVLNIDWSFLDVGRVRARIAASRSDAAGLLAQYQQTVLGALQDAENALVNYARTRSEDAALQQAAKDGAEAARLARVRYQSGQIDLLEVLDAERTMLQAQDASADSRARSATAAVSVYQALAGGWPQQKVARLDVSPGGGHMDSPPQLASSNRETHE